MAATIGASNIGANTTADTAPDAAGEAERRRRRESRRRRRKEAATGWIFVTPVLVLLMVFLVLPILLALYVSFTKWNGQGGPFSDKVEMVYTTPLEGASWSSAIGCSLTRLITSPHARGGL